MHPTILADSSNDEYSLNLVASHNTPSPAPSGVSYIAQNVLFGPDAAVEVRNNNLTLLMMGAISDNIAFKDFVNTQRDQVIARADELIKDPSDVVVFIGKWYHVDYEMEPFFRPYLIRLDRVDGTTETLACETNIFWTDEENEYYSGEAIDASQLKGDQQLLLREASEVAIRRFISFPFSSGFYSWSGILWHPNVQGLPPVYVPLAGAVSHRKKHRYETGGDLDSELIAEYRAVDAAFSSAKDCLARYRGGDKLADTLSNLNKVIGEMSDEQDRADMQDYVIALLGDKSFDSDKGCLREKPEFPDTDSISLGDIQRLTKAKGYWLTQRNAPHSDTSPPEYVAFLCGSHHEDRDLMLSRCEPVPLAGSSKACSYASNWIPFTYGEFRYLAFGPEITLSWQ